MRLRYAYLALLMIVVAGTLCCSTIPPDATQKFAEANRLYEDKDYKGAAAAYEELESMGLESGLVHFNLANTYMQLDETGKALVEYERAWRLQPRNEDIQRNRDLVTDLVKVRDMPVASRSATAKLLEDMYRLMNLREWRALLAGSVLALLALIEGLLLAPFLREKQPLAWGALLVGFAIPAVPLVSLLFWLAGSWGIWGTVAVFAAGYLVLSAGAVLLRVLGRGSGLAKGAFSVIVLMVIASGVAFGAKYRDYRVLDHGLALSPDVAVHRAPDPDSDIIRRIPQGTPFRLLRTKGEWREVLLPDSAKGWVESESAGEI